VCSSDRQQYAYRGAEVHFGTNDLRLLPALDRLARWYEETARPAQARLLHRRAFTIATEPKKTTAGGAVRALIGVARTYFVEYRDGPEVPESMDAGTANFRFGMETTAMPQPGNTYYLDPQAERALQLAIEIADRSQQATLQEEAVTAYGEYLLLDGKAAAAEKQFARAALLRTARAAAGLVSALEPDPLATPKPLLVRKPTFARRNEQVNNDDVDLHTTVVKATVTPQGTVMQAKVVSSDLSTTHQRQWISALERGTYRPRYVDGKAVSTEDVEIVLVSRTLKADRPTAKPEEKADTKPDGKAAADAATGPRPAPAPTDALCRCSCLCTGAGADPGSGLTDGVGLAGLHAVVAQDGVDRGGVEEEVRQHEADQVGQRHEVHGLSARLQRHLARFLADDFLGRNGLHEVDGLVDARLQFGKAPAATPGAGRGRPPRGRRRGDIAGAAARRPAGPAWGGRAGWGDTCRSVSGGRAPSRGRPPPSSGRCSAGGRSHRSAPSRSRTASAPRSSPAPC